MKEFTKEDMKYLNIIYTRRAGDPPDYTFSSVKEFMEAIKKGKVKPHSTILIDERIVYITGDLPKVKK